MPNVNLNVGTQQIALSQSRFESLVAGDTAAATKMGPLDQFKDLFSGGAKKAALDSLVKSMEGSPDAVSRFAKLAESAVNPRDLSISIPSQADHQGKTQVGFMIKGQLLMPMQTMSRTQALAQIGNVGAGLNVADYQPDWLSAHKKDDAEAVRGVTDDNFKSGGVHKKVAKGPDGVPTGLLRAEDSTGKKDFAQEIAVRNLAFGKPELQRYVSTQRPLDPSLPAGGLTKGRESYATFDRFNNPPVAAKELDDAVKTLTPAQTRSVLHQSIDKARVLYKERIAHNDGHMHNEMTYIDTQNPDNITLKSIDFGKSKVNASKEECVANLRYMFNRTAIGTGDGIRRAARESSMPEALVNKEAVEKHYPLHRLLARAGEAEGGASTLTGLTAKSDQHNQLLANVGDQLVADLAAAELIADPAERDKEIDVAFLKAGMAVDDGFVATVEAARTASGNGSTLERQVVERSDRNATLKTGVSTLGKEWASQTGSTQAKAEKQVDQLAKLAKNSFGEAGVDLLVQALKDLGHTDTALVLESRHGPSAAFFELANGPIGDESFQRSLLTGKELNTVIDQLVFTHAESAPATGFNTGTEGVRDMLRDTRPEWAAGEGAGQTPPAA
jgi:hypothetical protein